MLLIIRYRYPRIANILGFVIGVIMLAIGFACGASATVLILGGGSSVLFGIVRYVGRHHSRQGAGGGTAAA